MFMAGPYWYVNNGVAGRLESVPGLPPPGAAASKSRTIMPLLPNQTWPHLTTPLQSDAGRTVFNEARVSENGEDSEDLSSLDSILRFSLSAVLPANFGFASEDEVGDSVSKEQPQALPPGLGPDRPADKVWTETDIPRPAYSYAELIDLALKNNGEMTVRSIYSWIKKNFGFYRDTDPRKWQPSVRHTLTINPAFTKVKKVRGGNLWGCMDEQDQVQILQLKNHWKKQKIAEYEKTSRRKRNTHVGPGNIPSHSRNGNMTDSVMVVPAPLLVVEKSKPATVPKSCSLEKIKTPVLHKKTSKQQTPAKLKKHLVHRKVTLERPVSGGRFEPEEPVPEMIKTRHGRKAVKVNYLTFSKQGRKQSNVSLPAGKDLKVQNKRDLVSENKSAQVLIEGTEVDDHSSFDDSDQRSITSETLSTSADNNKKTTKCCRHCPELLTPVSSRTSQSGASPPLSTPLVAATAEPQISALFPTIESSALGDLASESLLNEHKEAVVSSESPGSFLVSDLQDFEPSESADRILASTSMLSFPSTTEAALILSSLENSPRVHETSGLSLLCQASESAECEADMPTSELDSSDGDTTFEMEMIKDASIKSDEGSGEAGTICSLDEADSEVDQEDSIKVGIPEEELAVKVKFQVVPTSDFIAPAPNSEPCRCGILESSGPLGGSPPLVSPASCSLVPMYGPLMTSSAGSSPECNPFCGLSSPTLRRMLPLPPAPWMMMGPVPAPLMIDFDEFLPSPQIIHDVPLSDAWTHHHTCKTCRHKASNMSPIPAGTLGSVVNPGGSRVPGVFGSRTAWGAPFSQVPRPPRPFPRTSFQSFLHPFVPSPVRPEQISQPMAPSTS